MTPDDLRALLERLESWAQNEEMIDASYLQHGLDCMEAANALRVLLWQRKQTLKLLGGTS